MYENVGPPDWLMELRSVPGIGFEAYLCSATVAETIEAETLPEVMTLVTDWIAQHP